MRIVRDSEGNDHTKVEKIFELNKPHWKKKKLNLEHIREDAALCVFKWQDFCFIPGRKLAMGRLCCPPASKAGRQ